MIGIKRQTTVSQKSVGKNQGLSNSVKPRGNMSTRQQVYMKHCLGQQDELLKGIAEKYASLGMATHSFCEPQACFRYCGRGTVIGLVVFLPQSIQKLGSRPYYLSLSQVSILTQWNEL